MKTYKAYLSYSLLLKLEVKANSKDEAESIINTMIDNDELNPEDGETLDNWSISHLVEME